MYIGRCPYYTFKTELSTASGIQASACAWMPLVWNRCMAAIFLSAVMSDSIQKLTMFTLGSSFSTLLSAHLHACQVPEVTMFWPAASCVSYLNCTTKSRPKRTGSSSTSFACWLNSFNCGMYNMYTLIKHQTRAE